MDCSLPGSSVRGIFQARVVEWGAIAFSNTLLIYIYKLCITKTIYYSYTYNYNIVLYVCKISLHEPLEELIITNISLLDDESMI